MHWIMETAWWYTTTTILGLIFFLGLRKLSPIQLVDGGWSIARILGILLTSFTLLTLSYLHILPFSYWSIVGLLALAAGIFSYIKKPQQSWHNNQFTFLVIGEILFVLTLFFWTFVRTQEPNINSLEKFMDFGFMQSISRMGYAPPHDMWYGPGPENPAGSSINYYYFGHFWGALLTTLSRISPTHAYNLLVATIAALSMQQVFTLIAEVGSRFFVREKKHPKEKTFNVLTPLIAVSILGTCMLNFGGNLHTLYLFTSGYENEKPVPFWQIWTGHYAPQTYWYPNATRFIPYTIHEFPSYSYVVADLHGHVWDIPLVLLTIFFVVMLYAYPPKPITERNLKGIMKKHRDLIVWASLFGFMSGIHYMTNAFDGPIYLLFTLISIGLVTKHLRTTIISLIPMGLAFFVTTFGFSRFFAPFASGVALNCAPGFLTKIGKIGPFLFEPDHCQVSEPYMLFVLWGGFIIAFTLFMWQLWSAREKAIHMRDLFIFALFSFGLFLILIPEFFYIKDIYPQHFRANTMFKMGYQAYILMTIGFALVVLRAKLYAEGVAKIVQLGVLGTIVGLVLLYPLQAIPSYYGNFRKPPTLKGDQWMQQKYPQDVEMVQFFNTMIPRGYKTILEAQGDSYTDYGRISVYTGLPTVGGWQVHEWLWRGSADIIGKRIPDIETLYTSQDAQTIQRLLAKYHIQYVVFSELEREKYGQGKSLNENLYTTLYKPVFVSSNGLAVVYEVK